MTLSNYTETYDFDSFFRVSSVTRWIQGQTSDSRKTYTTSYEYNLGGQLSKMIYPSGQQVAVNHDDKGRMQSLTYEPGDTSGYLTAMGYNIAGQVTGLTLGNGVVESYGYDQNRLQLTSQTATKSGGPANGLMNLSYDYQASSGQMGAGSSTGNAGQLMTTSGTINGTTESASFRYDLLGRLTTSTQSSNASSAQRSFAYDRWGNRTAAYDDNMGIHQIQNIQLEQSGGAPTNRITSITSSGSTVNYTYDAAGNVTNDGLHSYAYDGENRLVSVDGGATAQYRYDHQNRRVTKILGSSWTHYVWERSQVIGEHDGTTAYSANPSYQVKSARLDYVYAGGRMIQSRQRTSGTASWTSRYFLSDRLSVRMTLDASGNVVGRQAHLPFGEDFAETGSQEKHHFTGYERDGENGTDYAVNRQYAQGLGRFLRPDPFEGSSAADNPQSMNRYVYVRDDPTNATDPLGLCVCFIVWVWVAKEERLVPRQDCFFCGDDPRQGERVRDRGEPGHAGFQETAADCRKDMQSLSEALAVAEAMVGAIFINAIQSGGGDEARELSQRFQDALAQHPPGSINAGNRESVLQEFGALGAEVPSLFGSEPDDRKAAKRARRAASDGRDMTSSLSIDAQALRERCAGVLGLNEVERGMLSGLAARAQYDDVTFGSFYRGVFFGGQ